MAKAAKKPVRRTKSSIPPKVPAIDPKRVHELLKIPSPYDPPPEPIPTKGYVTWWDPGASIQTLAKKKPELFHIPRLYTGERCAKDSDSWKWRQWRIEPIPPGLPFEEQRTPPAKNGRPTTAGLGRGSVVDRLTRR